MKVLNQLARAGYQAYLVGGSVRDLLLGKVPKDFDVATDATPNQIKALFRNAQIIGRRFKLVHIIFYREIIEVATFRGSEGAEEHQKTNERGMLIRDNMYGTLDQDAWRRDFTVNCLYYNISDSSIIDFTKGVEDIHARLIRIIGDAKTRYQEDPVRMLRALRFSAKLNFQLAEDTAKPIKELSSLITHVSNSRLFEEVTKLYHCGQAQAIQGLLLEHGLFHQLFPQAALLLDGKYPMQALLDVGLESTDARTRENKPVTPAFFFALILWFPLIKCIEELKATGTLPPLQALEKAMGLVLVEQNRIVNIPKRLSQVIREIWLLQFRFSKRLGGRATNLLNHPRFRAAYDFFALRALAGDAPMELAQWWTQYQDLDLEERKAMVAALSSSPSSRFSQARRKRPSKPTNKPKPS